MEEIQKDEGPWTRTMQRGNFVVDQVPEVAVQMNGATKEGTLVTD